MLKALFLSLFVCGAVNSLHIGNDARQLVLPSKLPHPLPPHRDSIATEWFTQKLDHFDESNAATWRQRYMMNNMFYRPGGPAFLQFGGEGPINDNFLQTCTLACFCRKKRRKILQIAVNGTYLMEYMRAAKQHNGIAFQLEHRYYGQSRTVKLNSILAMRKR